MKATDKQSANLAADGLNSGNINVLATSVPMNLPPLHGKLIGRREELEAVRHSLRQKDVRLVTLTGFGGTGKTTLALHIAHSLVEEFLGGIFFVDLTVITEASFLLAGIARTLGLAEEPNRNVKDTLRDFLVNRSILFVLDNFEHLVANAQVVAELLDENPNIKVIATSREPLRLRGEQVLLLAPLKSEEAIELFAQRGSALKPGFAVTDENRFSILKICKKLDGLPLAIELAAMRIRMFSPQALLERFTHDLGPASPILDLLTSGPRDLPDRQRTLRDTIAWSYSLLTKPEQHLFRVAALFPAGLSIESLAQVAGIPEWEAVDQVASLVDKSLLYSLEGVKPRFLMLESLREFAREETTRLDEYDRNTEAFIVSFANFISVASEGLKGTEQGVWFERLDMEYPNLIFALGLALQREAGSPLWKMAFAILDDLHRYWMMRNYFYLGEQWVKRGRYALEQYEKILCEQDVHDISFLRLKATVFSLSGSVSWARGHYADGRDWHTAALAIYERLGDEVGVAEALNNLAVNQSALGELENAVANHRNGIALNRKLGDHWGALRQLNNMGVGLMNAGQVDEAYACFDEGLILAQRINDQYFIAVFLYNMADGLHKKGRFEKAIQLLNRSMAICDSMKISYMQAWNHILLANIELSVGHIEPASRAVRHALALSKNLSDANLFRLILRIMSAIFVQMGNFFAATALMACFDEYIQSRKILLTSFEEEGIARDRKQIESRISAEQIRIATEDGLGMSAQAAFDFWLAEMDGLSVKNPSSSETLLTEREVEVLKLLAAGRTNEQISKELVIVLKTVEKHVAGIMRKLGVKNRTEAAAWAIVNRVLSD